MVLSYMQGSVPRPLRSLLRRHVNMHVDFDRKPLGYGYQFTKWVLFLVEVALLCLLLIIAFLAPVMPGHPWAKIPQDTLLASLSAIVSLLSGLLFVRSSGKIISFTSVIVTPPCTVGVTVITLVAVPLLIGVLTSRGKL